VNQYIDQDWQRTHREMLASVTPPRKSLHDWTRELFEFYGDCLDDPLVMQRYGQMCRAAANHPQLWLQRKAINVQKSLSLFDYVEAQKMGTADAPRSGGSQQHPPRNQSGPHLILHGQEPQEGTEGRPRRDSRDVSALEERSCAVRTPAHETDQCTCPHIRAGHHNGTGRCRFCDCPEFTLSPLTLYDERAAANRERRTP
jgi:hypothetical protein